MKYSISNFNKTGVAWPIALNNKYKENYLEQKKYFDFQKNGYCLSW